MANEPMSYNQSRESSARNPLDNTRRALVEILMALLINRPSPRLLLRYNGPLEIGAAAQRRAGINKKFPFWDLTVPIGRLSQMDGCLQ
jgi:hypothetical protein